MKFLNMDSIAEVAGEEALLLFDNGDIDHAEWIEQDLDIRQGWKSRISGDYIDHSHVNPPIKWMRIPDNKVDGETGG